MQLKTDPDHLSANSSAAMLAAIEIYNKPIFPYRDAVMTILLLNAWELLLKAAVVKNGKSIEAPRTGKKQGPTRTLTWLEALKSAAAYFPPTVSLPATRANLSRLADYRNNAIHLYNDDIRQVVYDLDQTSIMSYQKVLHAWFDVDLADAIDFRLLPLGISPPDGNIAYLNEENQKDITKAGAWFIKEVRNSVNISVADGEDVAQMLSRITFAPASAGGEQPPAPDTTHKMVDKNTAYPLTAKDAERKDAHKMCRLEMPSNYKQTVPSRALRS